MAAVWTTTRIACKTPLGIEYSLCARIASTSDTPLDGSLTRFVFCSHGLTRNGHDFDVLALRLVADAAAAAAKLAVVTYDVVGRGESDWLPESSKGEYGYGLYAAEATQVLAHFGVRSGATWIGTSMGGLIGLFAAAAHAATPATVPIERLILNDIGVVVPKAAVERIRAYLLSRPAAFETLDDVVRHFQTVYAPFAIRDSAVWATMAAAGVDARRSEAGRLVLACDPNIVTPLLPELSGDIDLRAVWALVPAQVHVHLLRGADSDLCTAEMAEAMAPRLASAVAVFAGVGHAPALIDGDQLDAVAARLNA